MCVISMSGEKDDCVELLDQAPLLKVNPLLFHYIENDSFRATSTTTTRCLSESIHSEKIMNARRLNIVLSLQMETNILAIDTMGYHIPIRKSRLIPRQEQLVYEMIADQEEPEYKFSEDELNKKEHHILSPSP